MSLRVQTKTNKDSVNFSQMQLSLFFISQCSVLLLDAVMYSTQVSLLSYVPRLFFLKFYVMAAWGKGKAGAERQNSIIGACFHKLFHSCSNAFWRWKRCTKIKKINSISATWHLTVKMRESQRQK